MEGLNDSIRKNLQNPRMHNPKGHATMKRDLSQYKLSNDPKGIDCVLYVAWWVKCPICTQILIDCGANPDYAYKQIRECGWTLCPANDGPIANRCRDMIFDYTKAGSKKRPL